MHRTTLLSAVGFAATLLLVSSLALGASVPSAGSTPSRGSGSPTTPVPHLPLAATGREAALLQRYAAAGIPHGKVLLPNFAYSSMREGAALVPTNLLEGGVTPGPTSIGVNDLGLRVNAQGEFVPYSYRTTSLDGTVGLDSLSQLPIENNQSNSVTLQLNAVLNNVTIYGKSVYQIWAQNVIFYSLEGNQLQLATDAWNFTGAPFNLFQNDIYANSPGGYLFTGTYVHAVPSTPPAFTVRMPFTISFYLNATNVGGRNALYFNYSLSSAHDILLGTHDYGRAIHDGSFDWIIFNSTAGMPKGYRAPPASFLISGSVATGTGLPNDAEIAVCGGSDGFSSDIRSLDGWAQLQFLSFASHKYAAVPSAFTTTEDTGESVEGVDAHFTGASARTGTAYLTNGPEFVYGLWNATPPGTVEQPFHVTVSPTSALLWVAPSAAADPLAFNDTLAAWALAPGSTSTFYLPAGPSTRYAYGVFANDFAPRYGALAPKTMNVVSLSPDLAMGLYVPILAFGNAEVASIAQSGDGSVAHPYVIEYTQSQPILSIFGTFDFFTEPLYPGVVLSGVTAHVELVNLPDLAIQYTAQEIAPLSSFWGLTVPDWNDLPVEVYDSSNVSILHAQDISGWFPATLTGFLMGSLFLWNDSNMLVAHSYFSSMGSSAIIVSPNGPTPPEGNVVFGNYFDTNAVTRGPDAASLYVVVAFNTSYTGPPAVGALGVFSSGNTIYNNVFDTAITAYSPPQNPYLAYVYINDFGGNAYSAVRVVWHNAWNVPLVRADHVAVVNGVPLAGSLVGAPFEGGNIWAHWNGALPYTDQGLIVAGGDQLPVPQPGSGRYAILFDENGLPSGTVWHVRADGRTFASSGALLLVYAIAGPVSFAVPAVDGHTAHPNHGSLTLTATVRIPIGFT